MLKERMLDKMSDASRIVDRLVQKELVIRFINSKDLRAADILITQKGLDLLLKLDVEMSSKNILDKNINSAEAGILSDLLDKMRG
jgi:DNA-binding MarR family transcriptional regulator